MTMTATPSGPARLPLPLARTLTLIALGALFWFLAALLLRLTGPLGVFEGGWRVLLYIAIVPGTWPLVLVIRRLAGLAPDQTALGVTIATATASLLDGVALAWFPGLYGAEVALVAASGAAILWGAGVALVLGFVMNRPG